ncbi:MAG TPA: hypothetical protein VIH57_08630 [Bacteroidales bacterium]
MAQQKGILKIEGTMSNMTFYKKDGQYLVKEKSAISADKIANDPNFERTRENNSEFGTAGSAGKLLRSALRGLMLNASDTYATSRITQLMMSELKLDAASVRGARQPAAGLATAEGKALLNGFNFNANSVLSGVLFKAFAVNTATGVITISDLVPQNDVAYPEGATHLSITGAMVNIDFANGSSDLQLTNVQNMVIGLNAADVVLTPVAVPAGNGIKIILLKIEFFQLTNGLQYSLKNGNFNTLAIVNVA